MYKTIYQPAVLGLVLALSLTGCQSMKATYQTKIAPKWQAFKLGKTSDKAATAQHEPVATHAAHPKPNEPQTATPVQDPPKSSVSLPSFNITGKIGVTSVLVDGKKQAGSAFYAWGQVNERFAIELTGALGLGATTIRYDGKTATLMSEKTGEISASHPDDLLYQATGWHAPISQLPFWIVGQNAPSDELASNQKDAQGRLLSAKNGDWSAQFEYDKTRPNRLRITHTDGHRVVLTINGN